MLDSGKKRAVMHSGQLFFFNLISGRYWIEYKGNCRPFITFHNIIFFLSKYHYLVTE